MSCYFKGTWGSCDMENEYNIWNPSYSRNIICEWHISGVFAVVLSLCPMRDSIAVVLWAKFQNNLTTVMDAMAVDGWRRNEMETLYASRFSTPSQFFVVNHNKRLNKTSSFWWFGTPWRYSNATITGRFIQCNPFVLICSLHRKYIFSADNCNLK